MTNRKISCGHVLKSVRRTTGSWSSGICAIHEIVVDNTTNLFQIADVEKLFIAVNIPEDDLPELEALREMSGDAIRWTVTTVGSEPIPGYIDDISYIIDPNDHTAKVKGHIDNKGKRPPLGRERSISRQR